MVYWNIPAYSSIPYTWNIVNYSILQHTIEYPLTCRGRNMELASKPSSYWEECFQLRKPCPKFLQPVVDKVREGDVLCTAAFSLHHVREHNPSAECIHMYTV